METKTRAVLFDLDGTLVNSLPDICGLLNLIRKERGLPALPDATIRPFIGKGAEHVVRHCFPGDESQVIELTAKYREYYPRFPSMGGHLYPGVLATLLHLKERGLKIAVATNKPTASAEATVRHYLPGFAFDEVAGPERVSAKKPDPRHLLEVLGRIGVLPGQALFVGDDPVDRAVAEAAKVKFIPAVWGFGGVGVQPGDLFVPEFSAIVEKIVE